MDEELKKNIAKLVHKHTPVIYTEDENNLITDLETFILPSSLPSGLNITCDICGERIIEPGALIFGIPDKNNMCLKNNICVKCYNRKYNPIRIEGER